MNSASSSGTLKLASLGGNARLDMCAGCTRNAKVADGFTGSLLSSQKKRVGTGGCTQGQLIQGDCLASILDDPGTSSFGELQGCHCHLRDIKHPLIIRHGTDDDHRWFLGV